GPRHTAASTGGLGPGQTATVEADTHTVRGEGSGRRDGVHVLKHGLAPHAVGGHGLHAARHHVEVQRVAERELADAAQYGLRLPRVIRNGREHYAQLLHVSREAQDRAAELGHERRGVDRGDETLHPGEDALDPAARTGPCTLRIARTTFKAASGLPAVVSRCARKAALNLFDLAHLPHVRC